MKNTAVGRIKDKRPELETQGVERKNVCKKHDQFTDYKEHNSVNRAKERKGVLVHHEYPPERTFTMSQAYMKDTKVSFNWVHGQVTDTLKKGGANAKETYDVYLQMRHRKTGEIVDPKTLVFDENGRLAYPKLPNVGYASTEEKESFPLSDGGDPFGVIAPYGCPRVRPRPRGEARVSVGDLHSGEGERSERLESVGCDPENGSAITTLGDFPSVKVMRGDAAPSLTIGFDTEFAYESFGRQILSYQFALIDPRYPDFYFCVVFAPVRPYARAALEFMLSVLVHVLRLYELEKYSTPAFTETGVSWEMGRYWVAHTRADDPDFFESFDTLDDAVAKSAFSAEREALQKSVRYHQKKRVFLKSPYEASDSGAQITGLGAGWYFDLGRIFKHGLKMTLLSHYGLADLGTFADKGNPDYFLMRRLTSAGGGLVSSRPVNLLHKPTPKSYHPFKVNVRDTLTFAPAGMGKLADLGRVAGVPKIELPEGYGKDDMRKFMAERLDDFLAYGANDAVICIEYSSQLWGENVTTPMTLPTAAATALRASCIEYLGLTPGKNELDEYRSLNARFAEVFSGLTPEESQLNEAYSESDGYSYYVERNMKPIDEASRVFNGACADSYRGGYNAFFISGHITEHTRDFDLANAYPTAMACVEDVDFEHENGVIRRYVSKWEEVFIDDFPAYNTAFVGYVRFEFPESVQFPCIPVPVSGSVVFPRRSGKAGVYAVAPEIRLALRLGARVWVQAGFFAHVLRPDGETPSRALRYGVKQLIEDRNQAKKIFGKGSIPELLFKTAVNSSYGKTAQDVSARSAWDAMAQQYGGVGGSAVTSPYHATMTTSIVRAELLATMNQLHEQGYHVYSVTTDGFITNAPLDVVRSLDMYGMKPMIEEARIALSGDSTVWEQKHEQSSFLNTATRQNIALEPGGVLAHGGYKTPEGIERDSVEDRLHMYEILTNRTGRVTNDFARFPSFKNLTILDVAKRMDFQVKDSRKFMSFIDVKRKPVAETVSTDDVVMPNGEVREIVHYETEPWETAQDFRRAKELAKGFAHLGTAENVKDFLFKVEHSSSEFRVSRFGRKWDILRTILMGHRQGLPEMQIPTLSAPKLTVSKKCEWLSSWGMKDGAVTESDWKNARRTDRQNDALSLDELEPYLSILKNQPVGQMGYPLD